MKRSNFAAVASVLVALSSSMPLAVGNEMMMISVIATDLADNPITSIQVGNPYKLRTFAQDIRDPSIGFPGVFAAGVDISFEPAKSSIDVGQTVDFDGYFDLARDSALSAGKVIGYGVGQDLPTGSNQQFVFSVVLTATHAGTQEFAPAFSTSPLHENLLIFDDSVLTPEQIRFVGSTLNIVPEPSTIVLAAAALAGLLIFVRRRNGDANRRFPSRRSIEPPGGVDPAAGPRKMNVPGEGQFPLRRILSVSLVVALLVLSSASLEARAERLMRVSVFPTDLADHPIASIHLGDNYKLRTEVRDIRDPVAPFPGVFSAASDVTFDSALSAIDIGQSMVFGDFFDLVQDSRLLSGRVIGFGIGQTAPDTTDPQFLWSVVLTATEVGTQTFTAQFSDDPTHEYILLGPIEPLLTDPSEIEFVGSTLTIVPEPPTILTCALAVVCLAIIGRRRRR